MRITDEMIRNDADIGHTEFHQAAIRLLAEKDELVAALTECVDFIDAQFKEPGIADLIIGDARAVLAKVQ